MSDTTVTVRNLIGLGTPPPLAQYLATTPGAWSFSYLVANTTPGTIIGLPAAQGGTVAITGGTSSTSGNAGGVVAITGGTPGATGVGGAITLAGGAGGASGAVGGAITISAGASTTTNNGATSILEGGASGSGATGNGGIGRVRGGNAASTNGTGGIGWLNGGTGTGTGAGGAAQIDGGSGATGGTGRGGHVVITGGTSGTGASGNGGQVQIAGGSAVSTNGNGGDVVVTQGALAGTGTIGWWIMRSNTLSRQRTPYALTTSTTLLINSMISADMLLTVNQGGGANSNLTLPTGTNVQNNVSASLADDDSFDFWVINISTDAAETATIVTNTGWTLVGNMVVVSNSASTASSSARFRARRTASATWTLYRIG